MQFTKNLVNHIGNIVTSNGRKRAFYSFINIFLIALAVLAGFGVVKAWDMMFNSTFVAGLLFLIVCVAFGLGCTINGIIGQVVLLICSLIGSFNKEERSGNLVAFIVALLSLIGAVVAVIFLLR